MALMAGGKHTVITKPLATLHNKDEKADIHDDVLVLKLTSLPGGYGGQERSDSLQNHFSVESGGLAVLNGDPGKGNEASRLLRCSTDSEPTRRW
eukprot:1179384-Amorphochlora_amoeboformis.AAC.2